MLILFEDKFANSLAPIGLTRPAFTISCGGMTLLDVVGMLERPVSWRVRPHLQATTTLDYPRPQETKGAVLFINASLVPRVGLARGLRARLEAGEPFVATHDKRVAAALVVDAAPEEIPGAGPDVMPWLLKRGLPLVDETWPVFDFPHDVIHHHLEIFEANLAYRIRAGSYEAPTPGVYLGQNVQIGEHVVLDPQEGRPIVIERGASIAPFSYVQGPVLIGAGTRVIDHASIKEHTATGHTVKIGGEVESSILEPYTNKQHHGFLGHAYVGSWVNLGAGTTNSDLKNTYGIVKVEADGNSVSTGMQFLGCIIGDYCKSAVNTSIFTGKMIGVCSLLYGFVTTNVPSFANYAREFGHITEVPPCVVAQIQERMFERRGVKQRPEDVALLEELHELTRPERQLKAEQIAW